VFNVEMVYVHEHGIFFPQKKNSFLEIYFRMYKNSQHHGCNERLSESEMCYERSGENCDDDHQQVAP
jgi:hypothetical protein